MQFRTGDDVQFAVSIGHYTLMARGVVVSIQRSALVPVADVAYCGRLVPIPVSELTKANAL